VGVELELKRILEQEVDIVTYKGINPLLRKKILGEEIRIL